MRKSDQLTKDESFSLSFFGFKLESFNPSKTTFKIVCAACTFILIGIGVILFSKPEILSLALVGQAKSLAIRIFKR